MPAPHALCSKMLAERTASRNVLGLFNLFPIQGVSACSCLGGVVVSVSYIVRSHGRSCRCASSNHPSKGNAHVIEISDLEGGVMESLGKSALEVGAVVPQLVAAHREAVNQVGGGATHTLAYLGLLDFSRALHLLPRAATASHRT